VLALVAIGMLGAYICIAKEIGSNTSLGAGIVGSVVVFRYRDDRLGPVAARR
jgi:hypothetical protein